MKLGDLIETPPYTRGKYDANFAIHILNVLEIRLVSVFLFNGLSNIFELPLSHDKLIIKFSDIPTQLIRSGSMLSISINDSKIRQFAGHSFLLDAKSCDPGFQVASTANCHSEHRVARSSPEIVQVTVCFQYFLNVIYQSQVKAK